MTLKKQLPKQVSILRLQTYSIQFQGRIALNFGTVYMRCPAR